jgi:hypothetical protein
MQLGRILTGAAGASLLAASLISAAPAYASSAAHTVYVQDGEGQQYIKNCSSPSTCNSIAAGTMSIEFGRTGSISWVGTQPALGVYYKIINGTAVDGVDFNVPMTGEVVIAAGQYIQDLNVSLVNEHEFGTTKSFTIEITGTTSPITISPGTATGTIDGGNVPLDCSFTYISSSSQSLTCTSRPAAQTWNLDVLCMSGFHFIPGYGNDVTGDGTSTVANCTNVSFPNFRIDS